VLRSFAQTGTTLDTSSLAAHAAPFDVAEVLTELADGDFLCLDPAGQITAVYPFSALPTRHRVRISGNATVFAMCAIDALGISAMTAAASCPACRGQQRSGHSKASCIDIRPIRLALSA